MGWLSLLAVIMLIQSVRSVNHTVSGSCPGELREGDSPWIPDHYSIYIDLNPQLKTFRGQANITGTFSPNRTTVELHCVNLNVSSVTVNLQKLNNSFWTVNETEGFLDVTLPDDFVDANKSLTVSVAYEGMFNDTAGVIMQNYDKSDKTRWIIFTHLQPTAARTVFPCVDLPKYKATFDISIENPGRVVLSNMPSKSNNDSKVIEFHRTPPMSTYLVAFVVCDYEPVYSRRNITTWVPREFKDKLDINRTAALTPQLLEALENYMENAFSLPKLDQFIAYELTPSSGMENWGLIMYQEATLMVDKEQPSALDLVFPVAHELAHHWIGNSVTMADWCILWVQEALPSYLEGVISSQIMTEGIHFSSTPILVDSETDPIDRMKWLARAKVMDTECFFYDESDSLKLVDISEAERKDALFSLTRYYKGASVIRMIESVVTPAVFRNSLISFIKKYNNSYATGNELWTILENQAIEANITFPVHTPPLADMVETWETNRSHPVIHIYRDYEGSVWVEQEVCIQKYVMEGEWWVPITYTTNGSEPNFKDTYPKQWISPPTGDFQPLNVKALRENEWILLNIMGTGFYRVQYDQKTWRLLVGQLKRNHQLIPPINRAILIDDSFHTAKNGKDLVRAFEIMEYAEKELSPLVWEAIFINVNFFYGIFPDEEKEYFEKYMRSILSTSLFRHVTNTTSEWNETSEENRWLRQLVFDLSCLIEMPESIRFSKDIASLVINGTMNEESIPHEIRKKLWCTAVEHGPESIYVHVKGAFDAEKDEKMKTKIFERLQCSKNHTAALLEMILQDINDGDKASLRQAINNFMAHHWPGECKEILLFFNNNSDRLFNSKSEVVSDFQYYANNPPEECRSQTEELFGLSTTEDSSSEWRDAYGLEPLEWLKNYDYRQAQHCSEEYIPFPSWFYNWFLNKIKTLRSYF